jgi:hypothetical protein
MKIVHHVFLRVESEDQRVAFMEAGVSLKGAFAGFDVAEDDPRWKSISSLVKKYEASDSAMQRYTAAEERAAQFVGMIVPSQHGYPEPADDGGYLAATFDLADHCKFCGIGRKQKAPFRMLKSPALATAVLQLNWIYDEFFVSPGVWKAVFEPAGIGCRPAVLNRTGAEIGSVVQLEIPQVVDLKVEGLAYKECPRCGRKRYCNTILRQGWPQPTNTDAAIFKSSQYFGDGALAFQLVLVSNLMYGKITAAALKNVRFIPCGGIGNG